MMGQWCCLLKCLIFCLDTINLLTHMPPSVSNQECVLGCLWGPSLGMMFGRVPEADVWWLEDQQAPVHGCLLECLYSAPERNPHFLPPLALPWNGCGHFCGQGIYVRSLGVRQSGLQEQLFPWVTWEMPRLRSGNLGDMTPHHSLPGE